MRIAILALEFSGTNRFWLRRKLIARDTNKENAIAPSSSTLPIGSED
tara:strand:+ start:106 stop:246 length:141 start_codon:yes stop_codon:yes gene_type:complete